MPVKTKKPQPKVMFQLFVQDHSGDHNLEAVFDSRDPAWDQVEQIRADGGYWTAKGADQIFVPWHRVDFARITEVKK